MISSFPVLVLTSIHTTTTKSFFSQCSWSLSLWLLSCFPLPIQWRTDGRSWKQFLDLPLDTAAFNESHEFYQNVFLPGNSWETVRSNMARTRCILLASLAKLFHFINSFGQISLPYPPKNLQLYQKKRLNREVGMTWLGQIHWPWGRFSNLFLMSFCISFFCLFWMLLQGLLCGFLWKRRVPWLKPFFV